MLRQFYYDYKSGPFESEDELAGPWTVGNCRRAVQHYVFEKRALFLAREQALYPDLLWKTGNFVAYPGDTIELGIFEAGDIIFAERLPSKVPIWFGKAAQIGSPDSFFISLHTAIYTGLRRREIWHSAKLGGGSGYWSIEKFLEHYQIIAAKRM